MPHRDGPKTVLCYLWLADPPQIILCRHDVLQAQPPGPIAPVERVAVPPLRIKAPFLVEHLAHSGRL